MKNDQDKRIKVVTGVIGEDVHITGIRILEHALRKSGIDVVSLGIHNFDNDFLNAAIETKADAILISSLAGHAKMLVQDIRNKCTEAGLKDILLYLGGQLVVEKKDWADVEKMFLGMGFNRVYPPFIAPEVPISDLKTDLSVGGD
jgi:methylaspartate mutase sigma subunit